MAQLARTARLAVYQFAVDHDAAAHTRAECEGDEVLHPLGAAIDEFAVSRSIGVVGDHDRHIHVSMEQRSKVDHAFEIQVGGILDTARVIVARWCRDADAVDGRHIVFCHQGSDLVADVRDI